MDTTTRILRKWTLASAASGLAAMAIIGAAATLVVVLSPGLAQLGPMSWAVVPATAWLIGMALSAAQWTVARPLLGDVEREAWSRATIYSSLMAGLITLAVASWGTPMSGDPLPLLLLALVTGAAAGAILGAAQAVVLRRHLGGGAAWVGINAVAWSITFGVGFVGVSLASELPAVPRALAVLATGAVSGVVTGLITGGVLAELAREAEDGALVSSPHAS
jgi:hypothetical protein